MDKTNLSKLGDENDKLRQKLSDVQRENIKLKEVSLSCIIGERTNWDVTVLVKQKYVTMFILFLM